METSSADKYFSFVLVLFNFIIQRWLMYLCARQYLYHNLPDEDIPEATKYLMPSEDDIEEMNWSRDELSACENDAINDRIMKAGGPERVKSMGYIIKTAIRCRRVMDS
jgi:hypothetical protein